MRNKSFPNGEKGDGQSVKTQFAINIPRAAAGNNGSRATADQTQGDGKNFLGMENIWLLEFSTTPGDNTTCSNATNLEAISAKDDENSSSFDENNSRKIYQNVNVNTGTNNFLFYGFGKVNDKTIGTFDDTFSPSSSTSTSDIKFWLKPIIDETTDIYEDEEAKNILTALNAVANVDWGTNLSTMKKTFCLSMLVLLIALEVCFKKSMIMQ